MAERFLRSASLVDQQRINQTHVAIVGVGAIGSHLAEMLVKLGVGNLTLIDPDEVDTVNLGVQGFYEAEVGLSKVQAVSRRLEAIDSLVQVTVLNEAYQAEHLREAGAVFACVDSMPTRRLLFRHFRERPWPVLLDGRMAAESLRVFCLDRSPQTMALYQASLFASHQAFRESCTAKATIYCASMAAALMTAQFKRWAMGQYFEPHLQMDLMTMDCFR